MDNKKNDFIDIPPFLIENVNLQTVQNFATIQACEILCMICETCEVLCMVCETSCQDCQDCQGLCQICETICQGTVCQNCEANCEIYCECGSQGGCQYGQGGTKLPTPYLDASKTIKTSNSISVTIVPVANAQTYIKQISKDNVVISVISNTNLTATFTNLTPNTQYKIEISCSATGYVNSDWSSYTATTILITPWEWYTTKTSGGNFNVSADEWNDFCDRINQMRVAKGQTLYSFTTANSNSPFYAYMFKEAVNALDGFGVAAELKTVTSGSRIYAWYFTNLEASLNNAISTI